MLLCESTGSENRREATCLGSPPRGELRVRHTPVNGRRGAVSLPQIQVLLVQGGRLADVILGVQVRDGAGFRCAYWLSGSRSTVAHGVNVGKLEAMRLQIGWKVGMQ